jgi:hypothetical protein
VRLVEDRIKGAIVMLEQVPHMQELRAGEKPLFFFFLARQARLIFSATEDEAGLQRQSTDPQRISETILRQVKVRHGLQLVLWLISFCSDFIEEGSCSSSMKWLAAHTY